MGSPKLSPNSNGANLQHNHNATESTKENSDHLHPETDHSYNESRSRGLVDFHKHIKKENQIQAISVVYSNLNSTEKDRS